MLQLLYSKKINEENIMKITSFSPLILTTDPENTIKLFEELGFEKHHTKDSLSGREDIVGVRMNVDNFDEAREMLESHGFKPSPAGIVTDSSSKSVGMYSPSGFSFSLVQHIKD